MGQTAPGRCSRQPHLHTPVNISIKDFLNVVNGTFRSILSKDVLRALNGTDQSEGYYTGRVLYNERSLMKEQIAELAAKLDQVDSKPLRTIVAFS